MFRIAPEPPLRHPLPKIQVCEIGRRGGARGGREIQSVMKNYVVWRCHSLFQHLPAVLDEDVASVSVGTADVRIVMRYVL